MVTAGRSPGLIVVLVTVDFVVSEKIAVVAVVAVVVVVELGSNCGRMGKG